MLKEVEEIKDEVDTVEVPEVKEEATGEETISEENGEGIGKEE